MKIMFKLKQRQQKYKKLTDKKPQRTGKYLKNPNNVSSCENNKFMIEHI